MNRLTEVLIFASITLTLYLLFSHQAPEPGNDPHTPHYPIINTAMGGSSPGDPDSTTVFPQFHDIDYVKVYRRKSPPFEN